VLQGSLCSCSPQVRGAPGPELSDPLGVMSTSPSVGRKMRGGKGKDGNATVDTKCACDGAQGDQGMIRVAVGQILRQQIGPRRLHFLFLSLSSSLVRLLARWCAVSACVHGRKQSHYTLIAGSGGSLLVAHVIAFTGHVVAFCLACLPLCTSDMIVYMCSLI